MISASKLEIVIGLRRDVAISDVAALATTSAIAVVAAFVDANCAVDESDDVVLSVVDERVVAAFKPEGRRRYFIDQYVTLSN